jgi:hypothetical protein
MIKRGISSAEIAQGIALHLLSDPPPPSIVYLHHPNQ